MNTEQKKIIAKFIKQNQKNHVFIELNHDLQEYYLVSECEQTGETINEIPIGKKIPKELKKIELIKTK